jgi:hypothetical protein
MIVPRVVDVIREPITLREWLGHMTLFHANVQIRNDSVRTIYILIRVESRADASAATAAAAAVPPHTLEPVIHIFIPFHGRSRLRASP